MDDDGQLRFTIKDLYQQQQVLERTLADSLGALNVTLTAIRGHLEQVDTRNTAADQIHAEHAERIRATEQLVDRAGVATVIPDHEVRMRSLERFRWTLLGAVIAINALATVIEYLATRH